MQRYRKLTTICCAAVLTLGLAACGGGGGNNQADMTPDPTPPPPPMEYDVALPAGHGLNDGETTIAAGATQMLPSGTHITCGGTAACTLTVSTDGVTGARSASSTGGMVAVTTEATRMAAEQERIRQEHAGHMETLRLARNELMRVQTLFDAGDATANELAAAEKAVEDAMMLAGNQPPPVTPEPDPVPVAAMGTLALPANAQSELLPALPNSGNSVTVEIEPGETEYRQGVGFTCNSDYACTVTLTNNLGTIVASYSSQQDDVADMAHVAADYASGRIASPHGLAVTEANLVTYWGFTREDLPESGQRVFRNIPAGQSRRIGNGVFECAADGPACRVNILNTLGTYSVWYSRGEVTVAWTFAPDLPEPDPVNTFAELNEADASQVRTLVTTPTLTATELTGMGLGGKGAYNAEMAGLRSDFEPNSPDLTATTPAAPGLANALTGGSMLTGTDAIDVGDIEEPSGDWAMKTLFRDWGDTSDDSDGGFETAAIVVKNIGTATTHPWDADLAGRFANATFSLPGVTVASGNPYTFTVDRSGNGTMDTVAFTVATGTGITPGGEGSYVNANVAGAGALGITVTSADDGAFREVLGQFLGVSGTYTCGTTDCTLSRESGSANFTLGAGDWQFTPNPGSMVRVPDQDWMAYGAWMTTPDNANGPHRIGRFYNGFDVYAAGDNFDATNAAGIHGTAEYNGGATGIYVHDEDSGLFTATATLTATFDANGDGVDDATDYMISGRIHDFRGTDGVALGADTGDMPNPQGRGENDWVVMLNTVDLPTDGVIPDTTVTSGSADGLPWAGTWGGRLFGPGGTDDDGNGIAPTGVAGQFSASVTAITGPPAVAAGHTAVIGAFGATHTPPASN